MTCYSRRLTSVVVLLTAVVIASMTILSAGAAAERETATIQPGTFLALYFEMDEGAELEFTVTSSVAIYVAVLDEDNYQLYSAGDIIPSFLFLTNFPDTSVSETVEAPEDGRYYLLMENSASPSAASVTVDYEFHGTGSLLLSLVVGAVVAVVVAVVVGMIMKKRKAQPQAPAETPIAPAQDELTGPPSPPM
jgi:flagellar basal body-associated protein FliL